MFERFTDRARRVVVMAQEEGKRLHHNYIGTEHILLGLIREGEGAAAKALEAMGISLEAVRAQVEEIIGLGQQVPSGHIPLTPRAKKVLELSLREALQLGHNHIDTEHVLLGLVREGEGVAAQVLVRLGADLQRVREQVVRLLRSSEEQSAATLPIHVAELPPEPPTKMPSGSEVGRWAAAHARSIASTAAGDRPQERGPELRASIAGLPLLCRAGVAIPLALLLDLVRVTGAAVPADVRWRALAAQAGVGRLRALTWPPAARVALAGLLAADLNADPAFAAPPASPGELRDALTAAVAQLRSDEEATPQQASTDVFDVLTSASVKVTDRTVAMLEILGPAASAAEPTLPLRIRDRISSLPVLSARDRRLIADSVAISLERSAVTTAASGSVSGTTGVSRQGKITGLLPGQLALPEELLEFRFASRELLYRISEADAQPPPESVTLVLDTTPPTYGPAEIVLRLIAHVITLTLWTAKKTPALVSLDRPGLALPMAAPSDLATLWTARTLAPPDVRTGLATARRLGAVTILLTEHHLVRDLSIVPNRDLRVLTTHTADDRPALRASNQFHLHLAPDSTSAQVVRAARDLLRPTSDWRVS